MDEAILERLARLEDQAEARHLDEVDMFRHMRASIVDLQRAIVDMHAVLASLQDLLETAA
jgi:hypothetical protein